MALLVTSVFGVTGCGSDDDVQAGSRVKNAAPEASGVSDALSEADCTLDLFDDLDLDDLDDIRYLLRDLDDISNLRDKLDRNLVDLNADTYDYSGNKTSGDKMGGGPTMSRSRITDFEIKYGQDRSEFYEFTMDELPFRGFSERIKRTDINLLKFIDRRGLLHFYNFNSPKIRDGVLYTTWFGPDRLIEGHKLIDRIDFSGLPDLHNSLDFRDLRDRLDRFDFLDLRDRSELSDFLDLRDLNGLRELLDRVDLRDLLDRRDSNGLLDRSDLNDFLDRSDDLDRLLDQCATPRILRQPMFDYDASGKLKTNERNCNKFIEIQKECIAASDSGDAIDDDMPSAPAPEPEGDDVDGG
jgi:hypothetical protein